MEIDELFGLPAHALLVHVPVVIVPLALLVALLALWPRIRWVVAPIAALLAVVGAVGAFLAIGAGEELEGRVEESDLVEEHADNGEAVELPAILFAVVAVGGAVVVELGRRAAAVPDGPGTPARSNRVPVWAATAVLVVSVVAGGYATYTVVEAGHSGSKAVWDGRLIDGDNGGSGGGESDEVDDGGQGRGRGRGGDDPDRDEGDSGGSGGGY